MLRVVTLPEVDAEVAYLLLAFLYTGEVATALPLTLPPLQPSCLHPRTSPRRPAATTASSYSPPHIPAPVHPTQAQDPQDPVPPDPQAPVPPDPALHRVPAEAGRGQPQPLLANREVGTAALHVATHPGPDPGQGGARCSQAAADGGCRLCRSARLCIRLMRCLQSCLLEEGVAACRCHLGKLLRGEQSGAEAGAREAGAGGYTCAAEAGLAPLPAACLLTLLLDAAVVQQQWLLDAVLDALVALPGMCVLCVGGRCGMHWWPCQVRVLCMGGRCWMHWWPCQVRVCCVWGGGAGCTGGPARYVCCLPTASAVPH